ncbi:MAG: endonuclease/exonuclease/phosphatase family protein [Bacteroidetes bacterium]|nr:endonuclease/exonuclease/phosphatase family protein [Bacteroidota bacterium]
MSKAIVRRATKLVLITCNVLVALLMLLGCYNTLFDPQRFWYFGLLTLSIFYLLVILIGFIVFWLLVKKWLMLISIVAMVICWKPLREVVAVRFTSFTIQKDSAQLRVMSWNVEHFDILEHRSHPERKLQMLNIVKEYQPDIACFQEMVASDQYASAINYLPDFMEKMGMSDYYYSYNSRLDFDNKHHFGIIMLSRFPIINKQTITNNPMDYNSTFQYADIVKGSDTFRVFNVHLQSLKFSADNRKYIDDPSMESEDDIQKSKSVIAKMKKGFLKRQLQSERIKQEMNKSPYPVIVCGDFNDVPNSYAYNTIGKGLKNCFTEKGSAIGRTYYSISPTLRIDNIFVDPKFAVQQYTTVKKKLSDHFPVIADLDVEF